jgi:hypothetical protein
MGRYDKDRFLKELAIRYCLATQTLPFLEVTVPNISNLSATDGIDILTDIDVLGLRDAQDGHLHRTIFDCKTTNKMSPINRAFWAGGLMKYANCDDAHVILKSRAVHNHRISALSINVDLHDESSFTELGRTFDIGFADDLYYQSSIDRWNSVHERYVNNAWSELIFLVARNVTPLTNAPWSSFRKLIAELRSARGHFDPRKDDHLAIFLDVLSSAFVLWSTMGRDIRRFYDPSLKREDFEMILRYYIWGGKETYLVRQQLREKLAKEETDANTLDLPEWKRLVGFVGIIIGAPQDIFRCAHVCRELSIRYGAGPIEKFDHQLIKAIKTNSRIRQFALALAEYLILASGIPKDFGNSLEAFLLKN